MKHYVLIALACCSLYICIYAVLRQQHVLVHYYGYEACSWNRKPWPPAWHLVRPPANFYLYPVHNSYPWPRGLTKPYGCLTTLLHYIFKPLSACEEAYWYQRQPDWIEPPFLHEDRPLSADGH